jgi:transcriptional regulator with XRE-family HTH domain
MTLAERIKWARETCGKTQPKVGEEIGVTYQAVHQWEKTGVISRAHLMELPPVLDVTADWLFYEVGPPRIEGDELEKLVHSLHGDERQRALTMIEAAFPHRRRRLDDQAL